MNKAMEVLRDRIKAGTTEQATLAYQSANGCAVAPQPMAPEQRPLKERLSQHREYLLEEVVKVTAALDVLNGPEGEMVQIALDAFSDFRY